MKISKSNLLFFSALIIAIIFIISNPYKLSYSKYNLDLGQISDRDIIAPFDFSIHKSSETIKADKKKAASQTENIYKVSENLKFNAQKNLDFIFQHFNITESSNNSETIRQKLIQNGYELSLSSVDFLINLENRTNIYEYITSETSRIFNIGIYSENILKSKIYLHHNNKTKSYNLNRLYSLDEAKAKLITKKNGKIFKQIVKELADIILIENIVVDEELSNLAKEKAREEVKLTIGKVQKNEKIVGKNQKITFIELSKLNSLKRALEENKRQKSTFETILSALGAFVFVLFLLHLFQFLLIQLFPEDYSSDASLLIISSIIIGTILLTVLTNNLFKFPQLIIPVILPVLLISVLYDIKLGILYNFINFILIAFFLNWNFIDPMIYSLTAIAGITILHRMKKKQNYYHLAFYLFFAYSIFSIAISLIHFDEISIILSNLFSGLLSIVISMIGLVILTPVIERKLNMATKQLLLELLDFDNPLLKKISLAIPGTYHHALIVGNLAESAAEAIGANHLLTRVASYYHDIGKIENPDFFIENNSNSSALHDKMLPNQSALLIKKHIKDGMTLATKYHLPKQVINILQQHHGTAYIRYFHTKAKEAGLDIDENDFKYDGPKPQTKEAAIVMIADIVESTTKSLSEIEPKIVDKVLSETVNRLILEGQLDETPISLEELSKIKSAMAPIINGVYSKRIEYPKNDNAEN